MSNTLYGECCGQGPDAYLVDSSSLLIGPAAPFSPLFEARLFPHCSQVNRTAGLSGGQFHDSTPIASVFNLGHMIFLGLLNRMYRQRMEDPFSIFKVFRRDCLYGLTFECNRFDFDFEIVITLLRKGYRSAGAAGQLQRPVLAGGEEGYDGPQPADVDQSAPEVPLEPLYERSR